MIRLRFGSCIGGGLLAIVGLAAAAPPPVEVEARVDRASITIGDRLNYRLVARHAAGYQVELPAPGLGLEAFEIKEHEQLDRRRLADGRVEVGRAFVLSTFTTGTYVIPAQAVRYRGPGGSAGEVQTSPIRIEVRSILPADAKDIRGLHGPAEIPPDRGRLLKLGLAGLVLGAAIAVYRIWRHRRLQPAAPTAPVLPPYEQAKLELEALARGPLLAAGEVKAFYVRLTEILRGYLGRRFEIDALVETTSELLAALTARPLAGEPLAIVSELMEVADLVKFAKHVPSGTATREHLEGAFHLLEITRPAPEPPAVEQAA
jgi:hypothetical protein